ncbi:MULTISPECIES: hypothetical protein [Mycolicibacterium]|nr:hypothetical protein [Mycolicibacterium mageritense]TXI65988.1 MAG: hypothetical protein E6Q55_00055 [Mycolicibacterium mageritense]
MGRHALASKRRKPSIGMAALVAPATLFFVVGGSACPLAGHGTTLSGADDAAPTRVELVAAPPAQPAPPPPPPESGLSLVSDHVISASRWRVVPEAQIPRPLPVGVANERGLQVKTILAARAVSAAFPEIVEIGGVRPDALRWHPDGLAIDVMIPNPSSAAGIALGNAIVQFALRNAERFALQDAIWRGTYYTPSGPRSGGYGHYDHVHLTTYGGGYPTGGEVYLR